MSDYNNTPETPSVGQAVQDLRAAAGETARAVAFEAENAKDIAIDRFQQARQVAMSKLDAFKASASAKAAMVREKAGEGWNQARGKAKDVYEAGETYVKDNPAKAIAIAFVAGAAIGWLLNNRR